MLLEVCLAATLKYELCPLQWSVPTELRTPYKIQIGRTPHSLSSVYLYSVVVVCSGINITELPRLILYFHFYNCLTPAYISSLNSIMIYLSHTLSITLVWLHLAGCTMPWRRKVEAFRLPSLSFQLDAIL
jgi:hypothetical protein